MIVFKGRVVDGNGGEPLEQGLVVVEGNKIVAVRPQEDYEIPPGAEVIEIEEGTILPGFIDQHVHLALGDDFFKIYSTHVYHSVCKALVDLKKILDCGFTTIRECGGLSNYLKAPLEEGLIEGPRIFSAGKCIAQTGGHLDFIKQYPIEFTTHPERNFASQIADGISEVRRAARYTFREGGDFLKVMASAGVACQGNKLMTKEFSNDELVALVNEAENYGTYVAVHAHSSQGINDALRSGVKSIEHGSFMTDEGIELLLENDAWLIPTFATGLLSSQKIEQRPKWVQEKEKIADEYQRKTVRKAYEAGVTIGCGSDLGGGHITPFGSNGLEFPLLVEHTGMTPMEAIMAGTKTGAKIVLREDELGTLESGKLADIVVVSGNPLEDISILAQPEKIKVVMQDGKIKKHLI